MTKKNPTIILVRPQLPENIGMVARVMENFGLKNLILIDPREKWPNDISINDSKTLEAIEELPPLKPILLDPRIDKFLRKLLFLRRNSTRKANCFGFLHGITAPPSNRLCLIANDFLN